MILHLLTSTVVLAIFLALSMVLPLRARTRCTLLLLGLAKFAIPASAIVWMLQLLGIALTPVISSPGVIRILGVPANTAVATETRVEWLPMIWVAGAAFMVIANLIAYRRLTRSVLESRSDPSAEELSALERARRTIGIHREIALVRSSAVDAPMLIGFMKPIVVIPAESSLDPDGLHALLCHECAHLSRHDNVIGIIEAGAAAVLWFHPLVWLARRAIAMAREQACDEIAADAVQSDAFVAALAKICRTSLAPRAAGISCTAGAGLNERIRYMSIYRQFKPFSHRSSVIAAVFAVILSTAAASLVRATETQGRYKLENVVTRVGNREIQFEITVRDTATGEIVQNPRVTTYSGVPASVVTRDAKSGLEYALDITPKGRKGTLRLRVSQGDHKVFETETDYTIPERPPAPTDAISMSLKDADVRDVMKTFGDLTGRKVVVDDNVNGTVTLDLVDIPWPEAVRQAAAQVGARATITSDQIQISK